MVHAFGAGAALLVASLANFLHHNEYPLIRPEVGLIIAALLAIAAAMAIFYGAQRQWGRSVLEGMLAALFVDLNTDSAVLICAAGAGVALFTWWKRTSLAGPMAMVGLVVATTTLLGLGGNPHWIKIQEGIKRPRPAADGKPAIVHIILDEHIGIEGLPNDDQGRELRDELRSFYLGNGFATYGGAYSEHNNTINAVPAALNYGRRLAHSANKSGVHIGRTDYLEALVDEKYRLTIFQSDFAHYCADVAFSACITYASSSLRPTLNVQMTARERAELISLKLLALSDLGTAAAKCWNLIAIPLRQSGLAFPLYKLDSKASSVVGTIGALETLGNQLKSVRPGDAVFAHLLLPHFPYAVGADCGYLPWHQWGSLTGGDSVGRRRDAYGRQIRCTTRVIAALLKTVSQSPAGTNAVIILHGDHGSRITRVTPNDANYGRISDADMIASFSTLFAIRGPGIQHGYSSERQPITALLRDFAASDFRSAPHPKPPERYTVFLADRDWRPVRRVPLPPSWTKGFDRPLAGH
jgi:hypothetical protein